MGRAKGLSTRKESRKSEGSLRHDQLSLFFANLTLVQHKCCHSTEMKGKRVFFEPQFRKKWIKAQTDMRQHMAHTPHVPVRRLTGPSWAQLPCRLGPKGAKWGDEEQMRKQDRWIGRMRLRDLPWNISLNPRSHFHIWNFTSWLGREVPSDTWIQILAPRLTSCVVLGKCCSFMCKVGKVVVPTLSSC